LKTIRLEDLAVYGCSKNVGNKTIGDLMNKLDGRLLQTPAGSCDGSVRPAVWFSGGSIYELFGLCGRRQRDRRELANVKRRIRKDVLWQGPQTVCLTR